MISQTQASILRSSVNSFIGSLFLASFALGAGLLIWHAAVDENPIAKALANVIASETQLK